MATDTENTGKVTTYLYDDLGRLTSEAITGTNNNSTLTYTYDDRGNRLTQSRGNATVTYTYDLNNRLTSHTASGVVTIYNYDNNGNTISTYVGGNFGGGYTYDLFNRQKTYTPDGTVFTTTTYRPDGLRHSIGTTKHIWDAGNIVGDISGSTYKQYFRALNLIYNVVGTTKQYYRYNGHGDVVALTNSSGTVTKTYAYNAFGEEQNINATDANPFRYCGEYYDKVSGTLYLRARNYNASIGRFTQEDPIRADGNYYAYCGSNPVNYIDPLGLFGVHQNPETNEWEKDETEIYVGAAPEYVELEPGGWNFYQNANCYSYALDTFIWHGNLRGANPGDYSKNTLVNDVYGLANLVVLDLESMERSGRIIDSYDSPIFDFEYRIAVRVSKSAEPIYYEEDGIIYDGKNAIEIMTGTTWDYHFMRQTSTGQWAEKQGISGPTAIYITGNPSSFSWKRFDGLGYYDSDIVYLAISR